MSKKSSPLFSKPFLAGLMVIITTMVWVLNMTSSNPNYPQPSVTSSTTESGIPLIWLNEKGWEKNAFIEVHFIFNQGFALDSKTQLTESMFNLLLKDTFPLSTTELNTRLKPLATNLDFHVGSHSSELIFKLPALPNLYTPSMRLLNDWIAQPNFKPRTFIRWQAQHTPEHFHPQRLYESIYQASFSENINADPVTLEEIASHFSQLKQRLRTIVILGNVNVETFEPLLESLTKTFKTHLIQAPLPLSKTKSLTTTEGDEITTSLAGVGLTPIQTPQDWFSLQLWGRQLVQTVSALDSANNIQLRLELEKQQAWAWWRIQHAPSILQKEVIPKHPADYFSNTFIENFSIDESQLSDRLERFRENLVLQSTQMSWWGHIATQVTYGDVVILERWIENYGKDIQTLTPRIYNTRIHELIQPQSFKEVQDRR